MTLEELIEKLKMVPGFDPRRSDIRIAVEVFYVDRNEWDIDHSEITGISRDAFNHQVYLTARI